MKRYTRIFLPACLIFVTGLYLLSGCSSPKKSRQEHPNLVIVFPDQFRAQSQGFMGMESVQTPNIDRFAKQSLVLVQMASNYPLCSPTRAMLMSGKYPHANGVLGNCNSRSAPYGYELKTDERTWSDILKEKGYSLGYIGKWHLDNPHEPYVDCANNKTETKWNEWCPPERRHGFDFWYAYGTYEFHRRPMYWTTRAGRDGFHYVDQWGPEHEADMAIRYIHNEGDSFRVAGRPFALVVAMNPPHTPYDAVPEKYKDIYRDIPVEELCKQPDIAPAGTQWGDYYRRNVKNYYAQITGVDEQFGRILQALQEAGIEKNTLVVFMSDHGNCLGMHGMKTKNNYYEESMRIPFIIRWPGKIWPRKDDLLMSVPDIYPTLLDLMGFKKDIPKDVQGVDYASIFLYVKGTRPQSQLYIRIPAGHPELGIRGIRNHRYTLAIIKNEDGTVETVLFDNRNDPYQLENIAAEHPEITEKLKSELKEWLDDTDDPWGE
jgi:arylsulfatase A-like enzyme